MALLLTFGLAATATAADAVPVDLSGLHPDCGVSIQHEGERLAIHWPVSKGRSGRLVLDLHPGSPLIASMGLDAGGAGGAIELARGVEPVTFLTVGTRVESGGRPPGMSPFNEFFDAPAKRPHESFAARLDLTQVRATSRGRRATVALSKLSAGPFTGELQVTLYDGSPLVHVEAVVSTKEDGRAFLYDAGLVASSTLGRRLVWMDPEGRLLRKEIDQEAADGPLAVRHRAIIAESDAGSIVCFPPPHQFFFPRDRTDNLHSAWSGQGHRGLEKRFGFGIKQSETGGGSFAPWFNAPPGTEQRLGVFYLLSAGPAEQALRETLRFTHGDHFPELPGFRTLTSHWHMAISVAAMLERERGGARTVPDFVRMFKEMGVQLVHLAEFHGDGHPQDPGPLRLPELRAMFDECRRLSDADLLILPGEEANVYLGPGQPSKPIGHWLYLFPRPVYWTMRRDQGQPFAEERGPLGTVYHVGSREDVLKLLEREHGLAWSAHPRIKASSWTPDAYRQEDFYRSDTWLGAGWKAMPADLSRPRLGERALDLLDNMANWGGHKYLPGEVDVFKIDHTHELYGHMNINYVRLDRVPRFDEGWQPVLDALRAGRFFVTTGEVLVREFTVGGKSSGETLTLDMSRQTAVRLDLEWTFPLRFAEVITGDGQHVHHERIDLTDTTAFGHRTLKLKLDLTGKRWLRVEAWDVAGNGAFSQPVWLTRAELR